MKRLFLLTLIGTLLFGALYAQSTVPNVWSVPATKNWFVSTTHSVRGMGYNPVTKHVYVPSRDVSKVIILNAENGDSLGVLDMTGISGGTFAFNRLAVAADGRIYTTNLVTSVNTGTGRYKIYTWADESSAPVVAFNDSVRGPRLGDALAVVGSGQNTYVYASGNATPGPLHIFKRSGDTLIHYKDITLSGWGSYGVLGIGPTTNGVGDFWVNTAGTTLRKFDSTGAALDTVPGTIVASGGSTAHYFEHAGRKYVGVYSGNTSPSIFRIADVTDGGANSYVAGITAALGTTSNTNGTGEIVYNSGDSSLYAVATNNSVGKFSINLAAPAVTYNSRIPFVPNAAENDTVYFNILSLKPITDAKLGYYGTKSATSDQNGVDSALVTMTQFNGRVYSGIVPASANRNGRRFDFRVEATDNMTITGQSPMFKGYFAGLTKMALMDGPRHIDTNGVMVFSGYGIKSKLVVTAEDSVYQTTNNEIVLQDELGGVTVFKSGTTLDVQRGNAYEVTGTLSQYNGKLQFVQPGLEFVDMGQAPPVAPRVVTIKELLQHAEELENSLVEIRGVMKTPGSLAWPGSNADANMMFTDASGDSATMRVDRDTELSGTPEPRYPLTIIGVAGQFDNSSPYTSGYQWLPRGQEDIIPELVVRLHDTTHAVVNAEAVLPVMVGNITGTGITAFQFTAKFDTTALQFMGVDNAGSLSAGYMLASNMAKNGVVEVAASGSVALKDSGAIFKYRFKVLKVATSTVELSGRFNEGNPHAMVMGGVVVGSELTFTRQIVSVKNSKMTVGVTNVGHIGALDGYQDQVGFMFNSINTLYEGSLIMGNAKNRVPNAARFQAAPSWNPGFRHRSQVEVNKIGSTVRTKATFDDFQYSNPLGISVNQYTILDTAAGKEGYLILRYEVVNKSGTAISNFRLGSFFDFDLTAAGDADRGGIQKDSSNTIPGVNGGAPFKIHLAYQFNGTTYTGIVPLSQTVFAGGRIATGPAEVYSGKMVDSNKYEYISTFRATDTYGDGGAANDLSIFSSVGPYTIAVNDTAKGAFAVVVGNTMSELLGNARLAQKASVQEFGIPIQILTGVGGQPEQLPTAFALEQNYPNPFNPSTTIRFALPNNAPVRMTVYDMLGREVRSLINAELGAGYHQIVWDGRNNIGTSVATGVYIYRIEAGSFISTKKMMMMK